MVVIRMHEMSVLPLPKDLDVLTHMYLDYGDVHDRPHFTEAMGEQWIRIMNFQRTERPAFEDHTNIVVVTTTIQPDPTSLPILHSINDQPAWMMVDTEEYPNYAQPRFEVKWSDEFIGRYGIYYEREWARFGITHRDGDQPARVMFLSNFIDGLSYNTRLYVRNGILDRSGGPTVERIARTDQGELHDEQRWYHSRFSYIMEAGQMLPKFDPTLPDEYRYDTNMVTIAEWTYMQLHRDDGPAKISISRIPGGWERQPETGIAATDGVLNRAMYYLNGRNLSYEGFCVRCTWRAVGPTKLWT